jgi:hypothetical protein
MTEKRFTYLVASKNHYIGSFFCNGVPLTNKEVVDLLNENEQLKKENQKLKTQLLHGDGVCDICKHEYLVKTGEYYVSECKKGHEECSKIDLAYCGDFEVKECKE